MVGRPSAAQARKPPITSVARCRPRDRSASAARLDVIVLCSEGYTSSLAADALRSLGLHRATDVIGGFLAWAADGLPTTGTP